MPSNADAFVDRLSWSLLALGLAATVALAPTTARATHSLYSPRAYWDINNDGTGGIDDSNRVFQRVGGSWTQNKIDRVTSAAAQWRNNSDWNPTIGTSSGLVATIRVDGTFPGYGACGYSWNGAHAGNCWLNINRGTHYDIYESHVGINLAWAWNYSSNPPPAGQYDFQGTMTHELGHGISLRDLNPANGECGSPIHTMCGSPNLGLRTYDYRSLTQDDKNAANATYLP